MPSGMSDGYRSIVESEVQRTADLRRILERFASRLGFDTAEVENEIRATLMEGEGTR